MARTRTEERRTIERFRERYGHDPSPAAQAVERAGVGGNVGSNGYTTVAQADRFAKLLRLAPGMRLLDLGCGQGYPGVYLARKTGCAVVGSDLPIASLRTARVRAQDGGPRLVRRSAFVAASAVHPPFRPESFDAIVHTDLMC
jgi:2-polyprenyl-3-methyl-5-hydroxy-6-metoxy-1,4-benzoquinol methylase